MVAVQPPLSENLEFSGDVDVPCLVSASQVNTGKIINQMSFNVPVSNVNASDCNVFKPTRPVNGQPRREKNGWTELQVRSLCWWGFRMGPTPHKVAMFRESHPCHAAFNKEPTATHSSTWDLFVLHTHKLAIDHGRISTRTEDSPGGCTNLTCGIAAC